MIKLFLQSIGLGLQCFFIYLMTMWRSFLILKTNKYYFILLLVTWKYFENLLHIYTQLRKSSKCYEDKE